MSVVLVVGCLLPVYADIDGANDSVKGLSFDVKYNKEKTMEIVKEFTDGMKNFSASKAEKRLKINLKKVDFFEYQASGTISTTDGEKAFIMTGKLTDVKLDNGMVGKIGTLDGNIGDKTAGITIHILPVKSKCFAYVTLGGVGNGSKPEVYTYGETFDEMNELVKAHFKGGNSQSSENMSEVNFVGVKLYPPKVLEMNRFVERLVDSSFKPILCLYNGDEYSNICKVCEDNELFEGLKNSDPKNKTWFISLPVFYFVDRGVGFLPSNITIGFTTIKTFIPN